MGDHLTHRAPPDLQSRFKTTWVASLGCGTSLERPPDCSSSSRRLAHRSGGTTAEGAGTGLGQREPACSAPVPPMGLLLRQEAHPEQSESIPSGRHPSHPSPSSTYGPFGNTTA